MSSFGNLRPQGGDSDVSYTRDAYGNRKYANATERRRFIEAARKDASASVYTFCLILAFTGARLSEVLALTPRQIDFTSEAIVVESLKKRRKTNGSRRPVYRAIPIPKFVLAELESTHRITEAHSDPDRSEERLWPWCRTTAWKRVKEVMDRANIRGTHASPKGLRHGFAVGALVAGVPDITVMRWLGHARLETTMIYTDAIDGEASKIAEKMWKPLLNRDLLA